MTTTQILVTLAGAAAIAWVNYYFFHPSSAANVTREKDPGA
jgi:hypothetical protein